MKSKKCLICGREVEFPAEAFCSTNCRDIHKERHDFKENLRKQKSFLKKSWYALKNLDCFVESYLWVFYLIMFIIIIGLISSSYFFLNVRYMDNIGFNIESMKSFFIIFGTFFLGIAIIKIFTNKYPYNRFSYFLSKWINGYLILSLFLIALISTTGLALLSDFYGSKYVTITPLTSFPQDDYLVEKSVVSIEPNILVCKGIMWDDEFVKGDIISCGFNLTYNYDEGDNETKYRLDYIYTSHLNDSNKEDHKKIDFNANIFNNTKEDYYFELPINNNIDQNRFRIDFYFKNNEGKIDLLLYKNIKFIGISKQSYSERQNQKIILFVTIFSFSFFSVFVGVNNLRQIIENKD